MGLLLLNLKTCKAWWKQPRDCPGFGHGLRAGPGAALLAADVPGACSTEAQGQGIKQYLNKLFLQPPKRQATVLNVSIFCLVCLGCVCVHVCVVQQQLQRAVRCVQLLQGASGIVLDMVKSTTLGFCRTSAVIYIWLEA